VRASRGSPRPSRVRSQAAWNAIKCADNRLMDQGMLRPEELAEPSGTWIDLGWFRRPPSSKCGVAVVGAGTLCLDIGASGEGHGFPHIVRQNRYYRGWNPYGVGKGPYGGWRYDVGWCFVRGFAWVRLRLITVTSAATGGSGASQLFR
jgi:hypothetical protein